MVTRARSRLSLPSGFNPLKMIEHAAGFREQVPSVIEFCVSDGYLNRPYLYPRQATLLKTIFLQTETFCADEQTEILTRRGWKTYLEVEPGEDVLTLDHRTGLGEWAPAERINVFPVKDEPLVLMQGDGHSSLTTPNHRWPTERLMRGRSASRRDRTFVQTRHLRGADSIPCAAPMIGLPTEPKWSDAFVELVAWYWTEGYAVKGTTGVVISQSERVNPEYVARIRACLTSLFGPARESLNTQRSRQAWRETRRVEDGLSRFRLSSAAGVSLREIAPGAEKVVGADFLTSLTAAQIRLFIDVSLMADGTCWTMPSGRVKRGISQRSKARLDAFQMACSLAGVRTVLQQRTTRGSGAYAGSIFWHLSLHDSRTNFTPQQGAGRNFSVTEVRHTGHVWCPTTRNETWLARREGKVYFTGNTQYDFDVLGQWSESYARTADENGEGNNGIQADIFERINLNRRCPCGHDRGYHAWPDGKCSFRAEERCSCLSYRGRPWFRQVSNISGRRGSKGHLGGYAGSYVLWHYMSWGDPQEHFGVDRDKRMTAIVFAGKKEQARANQWKDLTNVILGAQCFSDYIASPLGETLLVYAPHDFERMYDRSIRGVGGRPEDIATFEIVPKESTLMAARGPAAFSQFYDEFAHVVATGANRSATEVWDSATPSLDQFKDWAFIYIPTSPWQKIGQAYIEYQQSIETNSDGTPTYPEKLMVQLTSWDIYQDWEIANDLLTEPDGIRFIPLKGAIQDYDDGMKQLEKANPETFKVERRSFWAVAMDAYLNPERIKEMWKPWPTEHDVLVPQTRGILANTYRAHGDPSKSGAGFGWAIGHIAGTDDRGLPHVVFDVIHSWQPADYPNHEIDYALVGKDIEGYINDFMPGEITFDQFNSVATIQSLRSYVQRTPLPKRVTIDERTATAPLNWRTYETFKTALNMGLVHGPYHELADLEMTYLQEKGGRVDHPTMGPVQTKDVADVLAIVVYELIGDLVSTFVGNQLSSLTLGASAPGGMNPYSAQQDPLSQLSGRSRGGRPGGGSFSPTRGGRFGRR